MVASPGAPAPGLSAVSAMTTGPDRPEEATSDGAPGDGIGRGKVISLKPISPGPDLIRHPVGDLSGAARVGVGRDGDGEASAGDIGIGESAGDGHGGGVAFTLEGLGQVEDGPHRGRAVGPAGG